MKRITPTTNRRATVKRRSWHIRSSSHNREQVGPDIPFTSEEVFPFRPITTNESAHWIRMTDGIIGEPDLTRSEQTETNSRQDQKPAAQQAAGGGAARPNRTASERRATTEDGPSRRRRRERASDDDDENNNKIHNNSHQRATTTQWTCRNHSLTHKHAASQASNKEGMNNDEARRSEGSEPARRPARPRTTHYNTLMIPSSSGSTHRPPSYDHPPTPPTFIAPPSFLLLPQGFYLYK